MTQEMRWRWTDKTLWGSLAFIVLVLAFILSLKDATWARFAAAVLLVAALLISLNAASVRSWCSPPQFSGDFLASEVKEPTLWDCVWLTRKG